MNNTMKVMLAFSFAVTAAVVGLNAQPAVYEEFKRVDQPFMFFKTFGKCPYSIHYDPAVNQLNYTFLGCIDEKTNYVVLPKQGNQLATMTPVRYTQKFVDANVQVDRKFEGYRETRLGRVIEGGLQIAGVIPEHQYEGNFMVDEYKLGIPMKWVLRDADDLKGLRVYLTQKFAEENLVPAKKPLLLLEIAKNADALDASDIQFLNTYFVVLNPQDENVKAFFTECQSTLLDVADISKDAKYVLDGYGDMVLRDLEKENNEFKGKEFLAKVTVAVGAALTTALIIELMREFVIKPATEGAKGLFKPAKA